MRIRWLTMLMLAGAGFAALAAAALAAHPVPGAVYVGNSGECPTGRERCEFDFRVSSDGRTLRFVKQGVALTSWGCQNGGGEAVFGANSYYRIPAAKIHSNGTFSGSGGQGAHTVEITGKFTGSGKTAVLKFVAPKARCQTPELKLKKR
jgi:hypothetical protein